MTSKSRQYHLIYSDRIPGIRVSSKVRLYFMSLYNYANDTLAETFVGTFIRIDKEFMRLNAKKKLWMERDSKTGNKWNQK